MTAKQILREMLHYHGVADPTAFIDEYNKRLQDADWEIYPGSMNDDLVVVAVEYCQPFEPQVYESQDCP